jgi:hypothetical protein
MDNFLIVHCGCEPWLLVLKEGHRLSFLENMMLVEIL